MMEITDIKDPSFLKEMSIEELESLAAEIRTFLIENIAKTGGHLSSNLGVVELTIALHYVFDTPVDKLLFDVGHQCYTHKILTGRALGFSRLRKYQGLSGFQKRKESEYDCFEAGHSSTSLSTALGMAVARDLNHENYEIIPVVGDGALFSGMSFEALNEIGFEQKKMIIVFNDNNMSISSNVGALSKSFNRLRNSKGYLNLKDDVKDYLKSKKYGSAVIASIHSFKEGIKKTVIDSGIFKEFNIEYFGPIDGHNIAELIRAFETAKKENGPCVIHVLTQKGKGYRYAENDLYGKWHGVGAFDVHTGRMKAETPDGYASGSAIVANCIEKMMCDNKDITVLTPAMRQGSALDSIFAHYPERSFDTGIAEEHAMTFASGMAYAGKRPFLAIYSTFLQRAYDQLNHDVCRTDLPVVLGIDRAGLVGADGETHQGVFDISFMRPLPNLIIAQGKDADEMRSLLNLAFSQKHPFALRFARENIKYGNPANIETIEVGKWEYLNNNINDKAIILSYGFDVTKISEMVSNNNLPYRVINCRFLKTLDEEMLKEVFDSKLPIFIYEGDLVIGGLGDAILEEANKFNASSAITIYGIPDRFIEQGSVSQLKDELHLGLNEIFEDIEKKLL